MRERAGHADSTPACGRLGAMSADAPRLTADLFIVPVEGAYLVYAPLRRAAFVANAATVTVA
jgi:hypothetical protein